MLDDEIRNDKGIERFSICYDYVKTYEICRVDMRSVELSRGRMHSTIPFVGKLYEGYSFSFMRVVLRILLFIHSTHFLLFIHLSFFFSLQRLVEEV